MYTFIIKIKIKIKKQMNKKKLFTFLLIMVSCPTMRTLDPIISLKTGVTTVGAKITNFFSNTKNVIWKGLATLLVVSSGIGLLYYNYKKKCISQIKINL
jgi:hypothetical protein